MAKTPASTRKISPHQALIYAMILVAGADRRLLLQHPPERKAEDAGLLLQAMNCNRECSVYGVQVGLAGH